MEYRQLINLKDSNDSREKGTYTQASTPDFSHQTNKIEAQAMRGGSINWGERASSNLFLTVFSYSPEMSRLFISDLSEVCKM